MTSVAESQRKEVDEIVSRKVNCYIEAPKQSRHKQDGLWSVLVCLACMLTQSASFGPILNFGILYPALLEHYKEDKATTGKKYI